MLYESLAELVKMQILVPQVWGSAFLVSPQVVLKLLGVEA